MKRTQINFDIDPAIKRNFKSVCSANGTDMANVLEKLVGTYIRQSRRKQEGKESQ